MSEYLTGHVKRDPASGAVAVRSVISENNPQLLHLAWVVATLGSGSRTAPTTEVDGWTDVYTPEPPPT